MRYIAVVVFLSSLSVLAQNPIAAIQVVEDRPTLTSLGFQVLYSGDDNRNASVTWRYRPQGAAIWRTAYPMLRVLPETVAAYSVSNQFAGSIVDLKPATTYEIEIQVQDPDNGALLPISRSSTTRAIPADPVTPHAVSASNLTELQNAVAAAQAGDVITIQPGAYNVDSLAIYASGTPANPIILRGASAAAVIFSGSNCAGCNILEVYGSYVRIETLTMRDAFQGIRFQGNGSTGNGLRYVTMRNVWNGVNGNLNQQDFYIADNDLQGQLIFPATLSTDPGNIYQDTYGIAIYGSGHVVAHNRISSFADAITVRQLKARALDIYGNDIPYGFDDSVELDNSEGNVRVFRNRLTNVQTGLSVQTVNGGPAYLFRNSMFNVQYEAFKFHNYGSVPPLEPSGVLVFHNTIVRPDLALNMQGGGTNHNSAILNNVFVGPSAAAGQQVGDWNAMLDKVSFDYNGYYPDGRFFFRTPVFVGHSPTLSAVYPTTGLEQHGRSLSAATFSNGQTGPANFGVLQPAQDLSLSSSSLALDGGALLPNFNDDYTGSSPDMGAFERNCALPVYGPRTAGVNESNITLTCTGIVQSPPIVVSLTPSGRASANALFTMKATDANGAADITQLSLAFGSNTGLANSCVVETVRATRQMYLWNDAGTARLGPLTAGAAGSLQNSSCQLTGAGSSVSESQNQVVWNANITFKLGYRQLKHVYGKADDSLSTSGWAVMGTWR